MMTSNLCFYAQSVTFRYSEEEDRMLLTCKTDKGTMCYWWTARMWKRVLHPISDWLSEQMVERVPKESVDALHTLEQHRADEDVAVQQHSQKVVQSDFSPKVGDENYSVKLCNKVNLSFKSNSLRVEMSSSASQESIVVFLNIYQLRQFLAAQVICLQKSDWLNGVPSWLLPEKSSSNLDPCRALH